MIGTSSIRFTPPLVVCYFISLIGFFGISYVTNLSAAPGEGASGGNHSSSRAEFNEDKVIVAEHSAGKLFAFIDSVFFKSNETAVDPKAVDVILAYAKYVKENPKVTLLLDGYADSVGSVEYNRLLSQQRALAVARILSESGVPSNQIIIRAWGELWSMLASNDSLIKALERRVTIRLAGAGVPGIGGSVTNAFGACSSADHKALQDYLLELAAAASDNDTDRLNELNSRPLLSRLSSICASAFENFGVDTSAVVYTFGACTYADYELHQVYLRESAVAASATDTESLKQITQSYLSRLSPGCASAFGDGSPGSGYGYASGGSGGGGGGGWGDGMGDMFGDGDFNMNFSGRGSGRGYAYGNPGWGYPYYGGAYAPYGYGGSWGGGPGPYGYGDAGMTTPTDTKRYALNDLSWNLWVENGDSREPSFDPERYLAPGSVNTLFMHLSAFKYEREGISFSGIAPELVKELSSWIYDHSKKEVGLTVSLIINPKFFERPKHDTFTLMISLDRIRNYLLGRIMVSEKEPFSVLKRFSKRHQTPDFVFANLDIPLRALGKRGLTDITIAFAKDGIPLASVSAPVCIADDNTAQKGCANSYSEDAYNVDSDIIDVAEKGATTPAASLQFMPTAHGPVMAKMNINDDKARTYDWPLSVNGERLTRTLEDTIGPNLGKSGATEKGLYRQGLALFNLLFPDKREFDDEPSQKAVESARKAFLRLVNPVEGTDELRVSTPTLFIRFDHSKFADPLFLPMGFMPTDPTSDNPDFVGFHFIIDTPLTHQSYETSTECTSKWYLAFPFGNAGDDLLNKAMKQFKPDKWRARATEVLDSVDTLWPWIEKGESPPGVLMLLGHNDKSGFSYGIKDTPVPAGVIGRDFNSPSVAILNACGTGEVGASDFVDRLNTIGKIPTIIATNAEVDARMAGDFFSCLEQELTAWPEDAKHTLAQSYFEVLQCLRDSKVDESGYPWGGRALKYMLLGNGNVRLCMPEDQN